ncbi:MAG: NAD(P)-dependent glycerol-3-phosphate dehydrogenase [Myxococcales bacterium]|nr:NAD(P)-dependent glycerol-3-phosphate dehydrogenase [Myxococcales bacterium]
MAGHDFRRVGVLGAGSWGTSLARLIACQNPDVEVSLWSYEADVAEQINTQRENTKYLKGFRLPSNLTAVTEPLEAVIDQDALLQVTPSHGVRQLIDTIKNHIPDQIPIISATKGIENDTLMTVSEVLEDILPEVYHPYLMFLSGPSFALEVAQGVPTVLTLAARMERIAKRTQPLFNADYIRTYISKDVEGVEIGGATKNVIAIAAGAVEGMELGHNAMAALVTRGLSEITRLAVRKGANPLTLAGVAGMGDLVLTCYGSLSRNRTVGYHLGKGKKLEEILSEMVMVAEGVKTARSVYELSQKLNVEMPICESVYRVLYEGRAPMEALSSLLSRPHLQEWRML